MVRYPIALSIGKRTACLVVFAVTLVGCRTTSSFEVVENKEEVIRLAVQHCDGANNPRVISLSPVQLSTNCGNDNVITSAVNRGLNCYFNASSRYVVDDNADTAVGIWLSVMQKPHYNELGCGRMYECRAICGLKSETGKANVIADSSFAVERDAEAENNDIVERSVAREIAFEAAKRTELALNKKFPLCCRVVFRRSPERFVVNYGVAEGVRDGDEFLIVAKDAQNLYSIVAKAVATAQSGRSILDVTYWKNDDRLSDVSSPNAISKTREVYAISYKDLT